MDSNIINHLTLVNDSGSDSHDIDIILTTGTVFNLGHENYVVIEVLNDNSNVYYTICDLL